MAKNSKTKFEFKNPVYLVKTVKADMKSPAAEYTWPKSGSVDDRSAFIPGKACDGGLYAFSLNHMHQQPYGRYFPNNYYFLILEAEASEVVDDGSEKCKVPRCNVVGCYSRTQWKRFVRKWHSLLKPSNISLDEMYDLVAKYAEVSNLSMATIRKEVKKWRETHYIPGDGCSTQQELDEFLALREELRTAMPEMPTQEWANRVADFIKTTSCIGAALDIWAALQRNTRALFVVHPLIERRIVRIASLGYNLAANDAEGWANALKQEGIKYPQWEYLHGYKYSVLTLPPHWDIISTMSPEKRGKILGPPRIRP